MGRLVLRRLSATVPVLLLVTAGVFLLLHLTPGDPIDVMMAESVDATVKETLRRELGLDRPIHVQYAAWMGRVLRGDLGRSIRNGEPVIENVSRRLRPSLELAFFAMECEALGAPEVGRTVLETCLAAVGGAPPPELVQLYESYRASVRAKVAALKGDLAAARVGQAGEVLLDPGGKLVGHGSETPRGLRRSVAGPKTDTTEDHHASIIPNYPSSRNRPGGQAKRRTVS